jgi:hypothetical protein
MKQSHTLTWFIALSALVLAPAGRAAMAPPIQIAGVTCETPPPLHCPESDCPGPTVTEQGTAVEPKTGRKFFLDYPCDLKRGEKVTFVLSLHGGGSYGNWQRHYFPIVDYKDKYRLVIATPNAPPRVWAATDDEYLQNIVNLVYEQLGKNNIKAFWLVGHSQGGLTSNRIVRTDFFKNRVDGWLSLSGGRLGGSPGRGNFGALLRGGPPAAGRAGAPDAGRGAIPAVARGGGPGGLPPVPTELPASDFSFIFETGEREMDDKGLPESSTWAARNSCGPRRRVEEIVDVKAGYVYDRTRQDPPNPPWGLLPRPGKAEVYAYPKCKDGRIVADVVRLEKGHTEGLEPKVTEALVKLMLSARGGKAQRGS